MSKDIKMADVFELPVTMSNECTLRTSVDHACVRFQNNQIAMAAAYAINSHDDLVWQRDDLVEALEAMIEQYAIYDPLTGESDLSIQTKSVQTAIAALNSAEVE